MTRPTIGTARPADAYASPGERIGEFDTRYGGGLMSVKADRDNGETVVELYRLDPTVHVRVPRENLAAVELPAEGLVAYAMSGDGVEVVRLTDGKHGAYMTPRQARSLARELEQAARAVELVNPA